MPSIERSFPAETLRAFRAWLGLSQEDVASILGISTRSVQAYEAQGGPEWLRYALLGWATLVHGATPRTASRKLGLPYEHHPLPGTATGGADAAPLAGPLGGRPRQPADVEDGLDAEVEDESDLEDASDPAGGTDALMARRGKER